MTPSWQASTRSTSSTARRRASSATSRTLPEAEWSRQSRCALWSVRDVLAHLTDAENYHRACLDGKVKELITEMEARGGHDIASANSLAIAALAGRTPQERLAEWSESNAETRRRF